MKKIFVILMILVLGLSLTACSGSDSSLKDIRKRGVVRVGVKVDVPGVGYLNPDTNELEGLEIDLAKLIVKELCGDSKALWPVAVTALTREAMLENGEIDFVLATFTITEERKEKFHFTDSYFQDAIGLMTFKDAGVSELKDLDGMTIGTVQFGTAYSALSAEIEALGIHATVEQYASYPEVMEALKAGHVDAFSADKPMLWGYVDDETVVLDTAFGPQDYGIATKLDHTSLSKYLDELMTKIQKDGRLAEIQARWAK